MSTGKPVDLYDSHYGNVEAAVYRAVRVDAFGEDLGQASWLTAAECDEFCRWLGLDPGQRVIEVACGTGGVARRRAALAELEGDAKFEELQRFLATVHTLASERRLSRFAYVAEKPRPVRES